MKKNKAFTLIEVLLVVIIVGIVIAVAAPNFSNGYSRFQLNEVTDDLLSVSRWAQAMAIGQERIYALSFFDDYRSYGLEREVVNEEAADQNTFEPVKGTLGRKHQLPDSITIDTENDRIEFYPDGTIDPATVQLTSPHEKTAISSSAVRGMMTKVDSD